MPESIIIPTPLEQKRILEMKLVKSVRPGETWYLVDQKWMRSLKEFLHMGVTETSDTYIEYVSNPGPINNDPLLTEQKSLRKGLTEKIDFEFVSEDTWQLLVNWYGVMNEYTEISRKALETQGGTHIEVYPIDLKCHYIDNTRKTVILQVSRGDLLQTVAEKLKTSFKIPRNQDVTLWKGMKNTSNEPLELNKTVEQADVHGPNHYVVIETASDRLWPKSSERLQQPQLNTNAGPSTVTSYQRATPGVCGLLNLGNTCFMNSVIQCMSNVPPITEYFLSHKYLSELNETNPLGMRGEIAKAYGELIGRMWSGMYQETSPAQFKVQVGKFNPTFSGYQQHDSQELLTFLLDGLHEDLNRIKKKPYIEIVDQAGKADHEAAAEAWANYKKRNDSIIVDTFHGLLKSTVICPECDRKSVTFDPFCYLSLPIPYKLDRAITITYIPFDGNKRECKHRILMARKDTIRELCREIAAKNNIPQNQMLVAEISQSHFHKFYGNEDSIENIDEKDLINVYELPTVPSKHSDTMIVPVCFWEICKPNDKYSVKHLFGIPFLITIPKRPMTFEELKERLIQKMNRHFVLPTDRVLHTDDVEEPETHQVSSTSSPTEPDIEKDLHKRCALSPSESWLSIYYMDPATNAEPIKLEFTEETCDLSELLTGSSIDKHHGRKILILQFTANQRREFYHEKPPECDVLSCHNVFEEKNKISVSDCMSLFTTCEKLSADDAWYCPTCKKHQRATKKFDLWKLPKILIIHLKRFSYTRYRRDKIDALIEFPTTNLCMDKYLINAEGPTKLYDLIGVCNHYGNMGGGHYTAYCKNKDTNAWYHFDDSFANKLNQDRLVKNGAYVLFYIAKEDCNRADTIMDTN